MKFRFKEENTEEQRKTESTKIRAKYPDRIPVVVEKAPNSQITDIDKRKFLVPSDISVAQFMWIIRRRIQVPSEKAIFLFVGKVLPQSRLHGVGEVADLKYAGFYPLMPMPVPYPFNPVLGPKQHLPAFVSPKMQNKRKY